jgi:protein-L-isoaspartate(D-aspartate) O-methyltransferase
MTNPSTTNSSDLSAERRFFAEEIRVVANLRSGALVDALATVPREQFLPPGPWTVLGEGDFGGGPRTTAGTDPRLVYHNIAIGIDPARMLFNGAPSVIGLAIDRLELAPSNRVLHIGAGTGYFTALIGHCVGPDGRVLAIEIDEELVERCRLNVKDKPWIEVRRGDGSEAAGEKLEKFEKFDAIFINAGVTHPLASWLDALLPGGRLIMPLTAAVPAMGNIGKGPLIFLRKNGAGFHARVVGFVAIYSAVGLRDEALNGEIGRALAKNPVPPLKTLRRDGHERSASCWLHAGEWCLSLE